MRPAHRARPGCSWHRNPWSGRPAERHRGRRLGAPSAGSRSPSEPCPDYNRPTVGRFIHSVLLGSKMSPMTDRRKVALLTREYPPEVYGGAGTHVEYFARELRRLADVSVHCWGK